MKKTGVPTPHVCVVPAWACMCVCVGKSAIATQVLCTLDTNTCSAERSLATSKPGLEVANHRHSSCAVTGLHSGKPGMNHTVSDIHYSMDSFNSHVNAYCTSGMLNY